MVVFQVSSLKGKLFIFHFLIREVFLKAVTDLPDLFNFYLNNCHKNDEDELWTNQPRLCFGRDFLREGAELWRSVGVLRGVDMKECGDGTVC